jgi:hypothetical protein
MAGRKRKSAATAQEAPATADLPASRRRSGRLSSSTLKSKYFEPNSDSDAPAAKSSSRTPRSKARPSKKAKVDQDDEQDYTDEVEKPGNKADSEDEFDEDAPPRVTFIPLPKMRDTGGIDYADDRLHKNTLAFLSDLKANNKRSWLKGMLPLSLLHPPKLTNLSATPKAHDAEYRRALKDWESYVMTLTEKIIEADPTIPELPFKDVNFRIYRDIRFSNDPTPYKVFYSPIQPLPVMAILLASRELMTNQPPKKPQNSRTSPPPSPAQAARGPTHATTST